MVSHTDDGYSCGYYKGHQTYKIEDIGPYFISSFFSLFVNSFRDEHWPGLIPLQQQSSAGYQDKQACLLANVCWDLMPAPVAQLSNTWRA